MKITVLVKPNARKTEVVKLPTGEYRVSVQAPAHEGRANDAVLKALAEHFDCAPSKLKLVMGQRGKKKVVEVT